MTHTAGFNAGIEAAVTTDQARRFLECAVRNWSRVSFDRDGLEDFRTELERFRQKVLAEALKRPEPSEDLRVERLAAWLADQYSFVEWSHSSEEERQYWRESARAALAAMGRV